MNVGVNYMREHVKEDARIHYVVTNGGGQPNVVPPSSEVWYYIRADRHRDVEDYFDWVSEIARGAAAMSRTQLEKVQVDADMHEILPNRTISEILQRNLGIVGPPRFTAEEREFARKTQADLARAPEIALSEEIEPLEDEPGQDLASSDVGDISWFVPVGELSVASYSYGAPGHSWQIVACTGTSIGEKAMLVAAKTLAATAVDLYASPARVAEAKADFEAIRKPLEYVTLIPEGQKAPKSIR
jgi:aminobenzoyl-glutamate utilization protein B